MASCFGKDLCEQFVGLEILSLGDDKEIRVRKEAINNLANIAQVVSDSFFKDRLLPFYLKYISNIPYSPSLNFTLNFLERFPIAHGSFVKPV